MSGIICVGLGGALGAVLRYGLSLLPYKGDFPVLTFVTNVLGALLIGCIAGMAARKDLPADLVLFLKTGVCGGRRSRHGKSDECRLRSGSGLLLDPQGERGIWL